MGANRVTIFSNGIADFRRSYSVKKESPAEISLPVRKDHIADVLGSLNVYGQVSVKSPPSFRPSNEAEGNLSIDSGQVIEGLAKRLAGARVTVQKGGGETKGKLVGLHSDESMNGLTKVSNKYLIVLSDDGLQRISVGEIQSLRFEDEAIQSEIDKALQRNVESIKPNSTFVELALTTDQDDAEAIVQYTVPAAAWKISYRLRQADEEPFEFQGFAIVDNNTEEDWKDFLVSVVTGEPITFSTDLADSKTPGRKHINVVRDMALGAVEVEEAEMFMMSASAVAAAEPDAETDYRDARSAGQVMQMRKALGGREVVSDSDMRLASAVTADAEIRETGDFCVFEGSTPVSIGANRSAVLPVFNTTLDKSRVVLHYKQENHPERPYRAIEFTNETSFSLGRGVCTVFQDGNYAGSCIMPATKPAGDALLPHALETGVRVRHHKQRMQRKAVGFRLADGYCYTSYRETQKTVYTVANNRDEPFQLVLDHEHLLDEPEVTCTVARPERGESEYDVNESLKNGFRIRLELGRKEQLALTVVETRVQESSVRLVHVTAKQEQLNVGWLEDNLVATNGPLANEPGIRSCLDIQSRLDAKKDEIRDAVAETDRLAERQERLRKNIKTGGHDDQTNQWKTDLGAAENKIVELDESVIPTLRAEEKAIRKELQDAMMSLATEWKAE